MKKRYLVTGGTGFIGRSLVKSLVERGDIVRSLDDDSRGSKKLLEGIDVELVTGDIRDPETVNNAVRGMDAVCHLAYVNGTNTFYEKPTQILDIAVRGIINVIQSCIDNKVSELSLASSPEAYQSAPTIPTDESVPLSVPDPLNPRYSYGGGKIISELMILNYGQKYFEKVIVYRLHSVYGPEMGHAHVIPQLIDKIRPMLLSHSQTIELPVQGTGKETRSFCYIDDAVQGILVAMDKGKHLNIYHVGTEEEVTIETLAKKIGKVFNREVDVVPGVLQRGSPVRRFPDTQKLRSLGFNPVVNLDRGLRKYITGENEQIINHLQTIETINSEQNWRM